MAHRSRAARGAERRRAGADLIVRSAVIAAVATLAAAGTAVAHEGPATDVLEQKDVFLPLGREVPTRNAERLEETVRRARRAGRPIKVAVIAEPSDLGEVYQFWRHPQSYARFLGTLLKLDYKGDLLIVMPDGFGLSREGQDVDRKGLRRLRVARSVTGLADSATAAVAALAKASGHPIAEPPPARAATSEENDNRLRDRLLIAAAALLLVALAFALPVVRRRGARSAR